MEKLDFNNLTNEEWRAVLEGKHPQLRRGRQFFGMLPSNPRCKVCNAPFRGIGGMIMRRIGRGPFEKNPHFCEACLVFDEQKGVEIEISMLFADVRGSTSMAEKMGASDFTRLMNRFFDVAMKIFIRTDAWVDRLIGEEVVALYIPGFAGPQHPLRAIEAARSLLRITGQGSGEKPWIPIGIGVHTGNAYVGLVGSEGGVCDLTAMGDAMNVTARLTEEAGAGEALVSEATCLAAGLGGEDLERRHLELKGRAEPVEVRVLRLDEAG
jgi:adenylate cyclase